MDAASDAIQIEWQILADSLTLSKENVEEEEDHKQDEGKEKEEIWQSSGDDEDNDCNCGLKSKGWSGQRISGGDKADANQFPWMVRIIGGCAASKLRQNMSLT